MSQVYELEPTFVPSPSNIPVYIVHNNGKKEQTNLKNLVSAVKQQNNFGNEEVTIFITGLPSENSETVKKANRKLVQAYIDRYNQEQQAPKNYQQYADEQQSSNENVANSVRSNQGNLIVIDLGSTLDFKRLAVMNIPATGAMLGSTLVELTNQVDVPHEIIHIVGQGVAAHVAGAAGDEYTRLTGHQLRRITALDPTKIFAKNPEVLTGLSRGDAEFVDAIHTSVSALGTVRNVGDVDFYPNGPYATVPGADNVVEAAMRATNYYAETVRPGNERNFPAVGANSLKQYKNKNGYSKRAYMGLNTEFDLRGDYMLEVNAQSPYGVRAPAQKQNTYHGIHHSHSSQNQ